MGLFRAGVAILLLVMAGTASAQQANTSPALKDAQTTNDCGLAGGDPACGNVGDPYEGKQPFAHAIEVTDCGYFAQAGKHYRLAQDIGHDPAGECVSLAGTVDFDLGGHTVTGVVINKNVNPNLDGATVYHGTVQCSVKDGPAGIGCIHISPAGSMNITRQVRFHHLTVRNLADPGDGAKRLVFVEWYHGSGLPRDGDLRFDHLTLEMAGAPRSGRTPILHIQSSHPVEVDHNLFRCASSATTCQGLVLLDSKHSRVTNNLFDLETSTGDSSRAVVCDTGADFCDVGRNHFIVHNNRAWRTRGAFYGGFHDNVLDSIAAATTHTGVLHFADEDPGGQTEAVNAEVFNNSFRLVSDAVVITWLRNGKGVRVHDNAVQPGKFSGGHFAMLSQTFPEGESEMTLQRNDLGGWRAQDSIDVITAPRTIAHVCHSGKAGGTGKWDSVCRP